MTSTSFTDQIVYLHENELWSSLTEFGKISLNMFANQMRISSADLEAQAMFNVPQKVLVTILIADGFFYTQDFRQAEAYYNEALRVRKSTTKVTKDGGYGKSSAGLNAKSVSAAIDALLVKSGIQGEAEIKFRLHKCYLQMHRGAEALSTLQSIPAKQRSVKMNLALGKLYMKASMDRQAVTCLKEALKVSPMSLDVAQMLIGLGVKPTEIQAITLETVQQLPEIESWFRQWTQSQNALANREFIEAVNGFQSLEAERPLLKADQSLLLALGQAQYYNGDYQEAISTFYKVYDKDSGSVKGMDCLAACLVHEKRGKDLEELVQNLMASVSAGVGAGHASAVDDPSNAAASYHAEPWVALGYYCFMNKRSSRAVYFAHKACMIQMRAVEPLLLKGNVLLQLKKTNEALNHFREAMLYAPYRYELFKGLVDCYLAQSRHREATTIATDACKKLNNSPRALTLLAAVLLKDPLQLSVSRAKTLLEKALNADPYYLPAVYTLVAVLDQEMQFEAALDLLNGQLKRKPTCKLHQMLGDLYAKMKNDEKALDHYTSALNIDPNNAAAQEGLHKIEQSADVGGVGVDYNDLEMEDGPNAGNGGQSDGEQELEESETEAVWSDSELNIASTSNSTASRFL